MPPNCLTCEFGRVTIPQRNILVSLICLSLFVTYTQKLIFDLVIEEMGKRPSKKPASECKTRNKTKFPTMAPFHNFLTNEDAQIWSKYEQDMASEMFYFGYMILQVPGGYLGDRFGARYFFSSSLLASSLITTLLVYIFDNTQYYVVLLARFLLGLSQASLYPNVATLISKWIPPGDKAKATGCAYSLIGLGYLFTRKNGFFYGHIQNWRILFYIWGGMGLGCYVFCMLFVFSDPFGNPFITDPEKLLLSEEIVQSERHVTIRMICPEIAFDVTVMIALITVQVAHDVIFFFSITLFPQYYDYVLDADMDFIDDIEWLLVPVGIGSGAFADRLIHKKKLHLLRVRKAYVIVASLVPAAYLVFMPYMTCSRLVVSIMRIFAVTALGFYYSGFMAHIVDVTHNFSGTLMALLGTIGSIPKILSSNLVEYMTPNNTLKEWKQLTWVPFLFGVGASCLFFIFAKASRRPWDLDRSS